MNKLDKCRVISYIPNEEVQIPNSVKTKKEN